jgi:hypothetical protein
LIHGQKQKDVITLKKKRNKENQPYFKTEVKDAFSSAEGTRAGISEKNLFSG